MPDHLPTVDLSDPASAAALHCYDTPAVERVVTELVLDDIMRGLPDADEEDRKVVGDD